jgi:hypothetical protein
MVQEALGIIEMTQRIPFQKIMILKELRISGIRYQGKWRNLFLLEDHPAMNLTWIADLEQTDLLRSHLDLTDNLLPSRIRLNQLRRVIISI